MASNNQIGIILTVDGRAVPAEMGRAGQELDRFGARAQKASEQAERGMAGLGRSMGDLASSAGKLYLVTQGIQGISSALASLPKSAFDYTRQLETSALGMAGIMGSMASLNGAQLQYNQALGISQDMIRKLGDDALRTAANSEELVGAFQALLAPGLAAGMKLDEIRQLTVVGTNAVKSMGLKSNQVVQELRDLVAGGITASSSTLATSLGLKDADIAKAKASSEGLFKFLMDRLQGFDQASREFGNTLEGRLSALKEGATRVAADGMQPLTAAISTIVGQMADLLVTFDKADKAQINPEIVNSLRGVSESMVSIMQVGQGAASAIWDNRDAVTMLAAGWAAIKVGNIAADLAAATQATIARAQASRLAAVEAAAESAGNQTSALTAREKTAVLLSELQAQAGLMQSNAALAATEVSRLAATQEGIIAARAQTAADLQVTRSTMAQAEAQLAAARAAGAQSFALALVREATEALNVAQARHVALIADLAMLGRQQAGVHANIAAAMAAQTAATEAAAMATGQLTAAQNAASVSSRLLGGAMAMLGGPIGITVTAVAGLAMWLSSVAGEARDAEMAMMRFNRAQDAARNGGKVDPEDVAGQKAQLQKLKKERDELLLDRKSPGIMSFLFGDDYQSGLDSKMSSLGKQITEIETGISGLEAATSQLSDSNAQLGMTYAGMMQVIGRHTEGLKDKTAILEQFSAKTTKIKNEFEGVRRGLTATLKLSPEEFAKAAPKVERSKMQSDLDGLDATMQRLMAAATKERDDALKGLNGTRTASVKLVDTELAGLKAKLDAERQYGEQLATTGLKAQEWTEGQKQAAKLSYEIVQGDAAAARSHDARAKAKWTLTRAELEGRRVAAEALGQQQASNQAREDALKTLGQQTSKAGEAAAALEAENQAWGKSKTAIEAATLAALQLKKANLTGQETQAYREELDRAIAAQQRWVDALGQADYKKQSQAIEEWNRSATEQAALYQDELRLSGMTALEQAKITAQRSVRLKLTKAEADIERQTYSDDQAQDRIKKDQLIADARTAAGIESSAAVAKVVQEDWRKTSDKISDSLTDALMRGFESGKDFARNLRDTVVNMFKTLVLRPIISAVINPVAGAITGALGLGSTAAAAGKAGGSTLGTASNAASLYSAYNSANLTGYLSGGSMVASAGSMLGSSSLSLFGTGMQLGSGASGAVSAYGAAGMTSEASALQAGATVGPYASALGGALVGIMAGKMISGGYSVIGKSGNTAVALGTAAGAAIGSFIPVIGTAIGGAIGGIIGGTVNRAFGMGAKKVQSTGITGTFSTSGASVQGYSDWEQKGGWFRSNKSGTNYSAVSGELDQSLDTALKNVTAANKFYANAIGLSASAVDGFSQSIKLSLKDMDAAGQQKAITEALTGFGTAMADQAYGAAIAQFQRAGETASDTLARLSSSLLNVNDVMRSLGQTLYSTSVTSADMASQLIDIFGGFDKLTAQTGSYYVAFYTEAERTRNETNRVSDAMKSLGYAMPATRDGYRALVNAQNLTTESGRSTYASLIGLSEVFAALTPSTDALAAQAQQAADALKAQVASYYQNFYTEAERTGKATQQVSDALKSLGYAMPATRNGYRDLVEAQNLATDGGRSTYAALMGLESAFAALTPSTDALAAQAQQAADAIHSLFGSLIDSIAQGRAAVVEARTGIGIDQKSLSYSDLNKQIDSVSFAAPSRAALDVADTAYAGAMTKWVDEAGTSVQTLDRLREATVKYCEQQKELANLMLTSAASMRAAVKQARMDTMTGAESLATRLLDYDKTYTLALSASGSVKAGYVDQMAAALPQLAQDLAAIATSRADWAIAVASLSSKGGNVAGQLDAMAPKNYQVEANTLLDLIDTKLGNLNTAAEQSKLTLEQAVTNGSTRTANGLQQIINQLQGKKVSAFAAGGTFTNGIVDTPTIAPMALFGEAGPEAIMPLARGPGGALGVRMHGGAGRGDPGSSSASELLLRELVEQNRQLIEKVDSLSREVDRFRQENNIGNSKIADSTDRQYRTIEQWNVVGLPATAKA